MTQILTLPPTAGGGISCHGSNHSPVNTILSSLRGEEKKKRTKNLIVNFTSCFSNPTVRRAINNSRRRLLVKPLNK